MRWYNQEHKHSGLKFVTPAQRHNGQDTAILKRLEQFMTMPATAIRSAGRGD